MCTGNKSKIHPLKVINNCNIIFFLSWGLTGTSYELRHIDRYRYVGTVSNELRYAICHFI